MTKKALSIITATLLLTTHTFAEEILEEITVISASKTSQNMKEITSNVTVITAQEIEERGYSTVVQALGGVSGISTTQNGGLGNTASVYLRGMDSKRTLVLVDGIVYNDLTGLNGAPFEHLMIDDIERIEIIKGAQSGIWGADASAGVINIVSKKGALGTHGAFHAQAGSFNTRQYGLALSHTTEDFYAKLAHNVTQTNGFSAQKPKETDLDTLENDGYKNQTTTLKLGYKFNPNNTLSFSSMLIDADGEYDPYGDPDGIATSRTHDTFFALNFNHKDHFQELNLYAKQSRFDRDYTAPDYTGTVKTTPYKGDIKEYGITSKIPYAKEDFVLVGAEYKKFTQKENIFKDFNNKGFFVTNSNTFKGFMGGTTILTESLRRDIYSIFENKTTGKIGLKHTHAAIEGLTTSVNYGTAYNVPTLYQLFSPYGSTSLTPESTKSFDVSVHYKAFGISYFDTKIDDMIDFDMSTYTYNNLEGTSKIAGVELSYQEEIFTNLLLSMNYTHLVKAKDQQGNRLKRRAKDDFKIALDYYGIDKLHIGTDVAYIGSRTDTKYNPDYSTSEVETGKYTLVNVTADYQVTKAFQVYGKIENLTDKTYQSVYGYSTSPRAFYVGVRAKF